MRRKMSQKLKNLEPGERLAELKKLQKKKEKELQDTKKELQQTEEELKQEQEHKEKVPIPQVAVESLEGLSQEEKQIVLAARGLSEQKKSSENLEEELLRGKRATLQEKQAHEDSLEETVALDPRAIAQQDKKFRYAEPDYFHGEHGPASIESLYNEQSVAYSTEQGQDYLSSSKQEDLLRRSLRQREQGTASEQAAASTTSKEILERTGTLYKEDVGGDFSGKGKNMNDWYQ